MIPEVSDRIAPVSLRRPPGRLARLRGAGALVIVAAAIAGPVGIDPAFAAAPGPGGIAPTSSTRAHWTPRFGASSTRSATP